MPQPLYLKWEWNLKASPLQLWPFLSDTNRFNRDAGLPAIEARGFNRDSTARILHAKTSGMLLEWEEKPFEWIAPYEFGVERIFKTGPLVETKIKVSLHPSALQSNFGTHVIYESWLTLRHPLLTPLVLLKMNGLIRPQLNALLKKYDSSATENTSPSAPSSGDIKIRELADFSKISSSTRKLAAYIESADDINLVRMRPYAIASKLEISRQEMLETFLTAAHQKLLEFQWEVVCPHCRGAEKRGPSLEIISQEGYCQSCDLNYTVNFDQLIELTFRPNPRIRKISAAFFCTGGPSVTPHIKTQKRINSLQTEKLTPNLEPGLYRIRTVRDKQSRVFRISEKGTPSIQFKITNKEIEGPQEVISAPVEWSIENTTNKPLLFALEQLEWTKDAVPGKDVIHMRLFRDLFQTQCLRPNQPIASGELTIAFTDLKGSTKMYQEIGDPKAFSQVMSHFDILQDTVSAHGGTVIKTIGDSVMAVFDNPAKALLAMASAQKSLANPPQGKQIPMSLKVGIHKGPNLVVNLNNRLDYFGSAVNIAARLVSLSSGQDIIISSEMAADPQTSIFLHNAQSGFKIEKIQTTIKGFGKENFTLFQLISR